MGKWEIRPLATPKPLNRSSPKDANVITSRISTNMQNLVTIPQGVSFPRMREIAHQNVYSASLFGFFQRPTAQAPEPIFTHSTSNDVVRAMMCLFGVRKQKKISKNSYSQKSAIFVSAFEETFGRKPLYNGGCSM